MSAYRAKLFASEAVNTRITSPNMRPSAQNSQRPAADRQIAARVEIESTESGLHDHCASAYFTFVALDTNGRPMPVPELELETATDKRRHAEASERRERRLKR